MSDKQQPASAAAAETPPAVSPPVAKADNAGAPGAASGVTTGTGTTNGVNADRVASANAVIQLQANYLKQSAYAPLIVLCADKLANLPPSVPPDDSLAANCVDALKSYAKIQATQLSKEANALDTVADGKPASGAGGKKPTTPR